MIELLKGYKDKDNNNILVLSYKNGRYLCSYGDGRKVLLKSDEIFSKSEVKKVIEPVYFEEESVRFFEEKEIPPIEEMIIKEQPMKQVLEINKVEPVSIKNKEEPVEDDFFKDFM